MEDGEGGGGVLRKKKLGTGEVDFKEKSGTAWSHSYLNQKPWHPLSYPNQRRKWIAEQTKAQHQRRADDVAREFAQEQEFFRQNALISKKEKEKVEIMKAVSFMYVRPPGYNAESAKAAEVEDEKKREDGSYPQSSNDVVAEASVMPVEEKKKSRPKDVFGRALPTGEEFEALKNAPRLETGVAGRAKPFGIEIRNVKCLRCENYGHQSGDRECSLKDTIMPNEEKRLKRDDPLTSIMAHADSSEPLKWELKQKPGLSPPRGGFKPDDPNQQIVAEDDIFDEYGGFLNGPDIPDLLTNFSIMKKSKKNSKKKKTKKRQNSDSSDDSEVRNRRKRQNSDSSDDSEVRNRRKHRHRSISSDSERNLKRSRNRHRSVSPDSERGRRRSKNRHRSVSPDSERDRRRSKNWHRPLLRDSERERKRSKHKHRSVSPDDSYYDRHRNRIKARCFDDAEEEKARKRSKQRLDSASPKEFEDRYRPSVSRNDSDYDKHRERHKHRHSDSSEDSEYERDHNRQKHRRHPQRR